MGSNFGNHKALLFPSYEVEVNEPVAEVTATLLTIRKLRTLRTKKPQQLQVKLLRRWMVDSLSGVSGITPQIALPVSRPVSVDHVQGPFPVSSNGIIPGTTFLRRLKRIRLSPRSNSKVDPTFGEWLALPGGVPVEREFRLSR